MGAGAVGGTVAARLAEAGHDPVVVETDAAQRARLLDPGLVVDGGEPVPLDVHAPSDAVQLDRPCDVLLLAVRSDQTEAALAPFAGRDADVVSLQNGLNEDRIAGLVGASRTVGCVVGFGATYLEPGRIEVTAEGALVIGRLDRRVDSRLEAVQGVLADAFPTTVTDDIRAQLWVKMLVNAVTVLGAVGGLLTGEVLAPQRRDVVTAVLAEAAAVALAEGVALPDVLGVDPRLLAGRGAGWRDQLDPVLDAVAQHAGGVKSVTLRDFELGRRPEIEAVTGEIVHRGARHGVDTPVNTAAYGVLMAIADGRRLPEPGNFADLAAAVP